MQRPRSSSISSPVAILIPSSNPSPWSQGGLFLLALLLSENSFVLSSRGFFRKAPEEFLLSPFCCQLYKASCLLSEIYIFGKRDSWGKNSFHSFLTFDVTPQTCG
jgi:hypothetical protein